MQEQEYEIMQVKAGNAWSSGHSGNVLDMQGYILVLKGVSEPVVLNKKIPVAHEPLVGEKLYGVLESKVNAKGNAYMKFTAKPRPEPPQAPMTAPIAKATSWDSPEKQQAINRAVALNNAAILYQGIGVAAVVENIIAIADTFYTWLSMTDKGKVDHIMGETDSLDGIDY